MKRHTGRLALVQTIHGLNGGVGWRAVGGYQWRGSTLAPHDAEAGVEPYPVMRQPTVLSAFAEVAETVAACGLFAERRHQQDEERLADPFWAASLVNSDDVQEVGFEAALDRAKRKHRQNVRAQRVANQRRAKEEIKRFADRYGLLPEPLREERVKIRTEWGEADVLGGVVSRGSRLATWVAACEEFLPLWRLWRLIEADERTDQNRAELARWVQWTRWEQWGEEEEGVSIALPEHAGYGRPYPAPVLLETREGGAGEPLALFQRSGDLVEPTRFFLKREVAKRLRGHINLEPGVTAGDPPNVLAPDSLISAIYLHFLDQLVGVRSGKKLVCKGCGRSFVQTEPKQRYCPNPLGPGKPSLCSGAARISTYRARAETQ